MRRLGMGCVGAMRERRDTIWRTNRASLRNMRYIITVLLPLKLQTMYLKAMVDGLSLFHVPDTAK